MKKYIVFILFILYHSCIYPQKPPARDIGIPFAATPGKFNAITDVKGVEVNVLKVSIQQ